MLGELRFKHFGGGIICGCPNATQIFENSVLTKRKLYFNDMFAFLEGVDIQAERAKTARAVEKAEKAERALAAKDSALAARDAKLAEYERRFGKLDV